jgi:hypothetical protein
LSYNTPPSHGSPSAFSAELQRATPSQSDPSDATVAEPDQPADNASSGFKPRTALPAKGTPQSPSRTAKQGGGVFAVVSAQSVSQQPPPPMTFLLGLAAFTAADADTGADTAAGDSSASADGNAAKAPVSGAATVSPSSLTAPGAAPTPPQSSPAPDPLAFTARIDTSGKSSSAVQPLLSKQPASPQSNTDPQAPQPPAVTKAEDLQAAGVAPKPTVAAVVAPSHNDSPSSAPPPPVHTAEVSLLENSHSGASSQTQQSSAVSQSSEIDASNAPQAPQSRDFAIRIGGPDQAQASIRVREVAGEMRVAVHSPDVELTKSLRSDLDGLVGRLESAGLKTQVWHPAQGSAAGNSSDSQSPDSAGSGKWQKNPQSSQPETNQERQGRKSRWLEEMEKQK